MSFIPIVPWLEKTFRLPDTGKLVTLQPHQKRILELAFTPDSRGRLPYNLVVYSAPKKSGKTTVGAMVAHWFLFCVCKPLGEIYICANKEEQARSRVYQTLRNAIEHEPVLYEQLDGPPQRLMLRTRAGVEVNVLPADYAGIAGANPDLSVWDELWGYIHESAYRLWEELTPPPTKPNSVRFVVTYAGFIGESKLLENIYRQVVKPENLIPGEDLPVYRSGSAFVYWDHEPRMPWQTPDYYERERNSPGFRLSSYLRLHENRWVSSSNPVDLELLRRCTDPDYTVPGPTKDLPLAVGVDAAVRHDRAAVVSVYKRAGKLYLGPRAWWEPVKGEVLNLEDTVEAYLRYLAEQYNVALVYYDPYQFVSVAQRLERDGLPLVEYRQVQTNQLRMTSQLLSLLRSERLVLPPDVELEKEFAQVTLVEVPGRGVRLDKSQASKKIDSIVALAMACMAAEEVYEAGEVGEVGFVVRRPGLGRVTKLGGTQDIGRPRTAYEAFVRGYDIP